MNLYISVDIEGATGIASFSQCGRADSGHYDFRFARRMLTEDLNAVIRGARRAGAERIVLKDAHGNCKNVLIDELEPGVELISGQGPVNDGMMDGIDETFHAAMLIGYHAMAGRARAMMDHALVGGLHRLWVNDNEAGEMLVSAAVAGAFSVPTVLVSSDSEGCAEASEAIPGVATFSIKTGLGRSMGVMDHGSTTSPGLERAAESAMREAHKRNSFRIEGPTSFRTSFRTTEEVELASKLEGIHRLDGYTLEWTSPDLLTAHRLAVLAYQMSVRGRKAQV